MAGLISKEESGHRDLVSECSASWLLAGAGRDGAAIRTGNGLNNTFEIVCLVVTAPAPAHHHYHYTGVGTTRTASMFCIY